MPVSHAQFALRIGLAFVLGSIIGLERQWLQRNAGLRTNALVATGTALFILLTPLLGVEGNVYQIASYVVSGIGFLAGGVIFKERLAVSGLNTAATLWCTAAVGELVGFGFFIEATIGVIAIFAANVALRPLAHMISVRGRENSDVITSYEIHAICAAGNADHTRSAMVVALKTAHLAMTAVYTEMLENTSSVEIIADITVSGRVVPRLERVVSYLAAARGVQAASWRLVPTSDEEKSLVPEPEN